jgi:L-lactate utilization protein LutB
MKKITKKIKNYIESINLSNYQENIDNVINYMEKIKEEIKSKENLKYIENLKDKLMETKQTLNTKLNTYLKDGKKEINYYALNLAKYLDKILKK